MCFRRTVVKYYSTPLIWEFKRPIEYRFKNLYHKKINYFSELTRLERTPLFTDISYTLDLS